MLRDLESAAAGLIDERQRGWIANLHGLTAARRHDYPEAERWFTQMRQIGRAIGDSDLTSTALQNLAIASSVAGRLEEARNLSWESFQIKVASGDNFGATQVILNVVSVLIDEDRSSDAGRLLDDLESALDFRGHPALRSSITGNRGRIAVTDGDLSTARERFQESLRDARASGSARREIMALQSLGACAIDRAEFGQAVRWYRKAVRRSADIGDGVGNRQQTRYLAAALARAGRYVEAAELFEVAAEAARADNLDEFALALADAGASWWHASNVSRARASIGNALACGGLADDDEWRSHVVANYALVLADSDDLDESLAYYEQAANLAPSFEARAEMLSAAAEAALRRADLLEMAVDLYSREIELRRMSESGDRWGWRAAEIGARLTYTPLVGSAIVFLSQALRVFAARPDPRLVFFVRNDRAVARVRRGELPQATADFNACLRIATQLGDAVLAQQSHANLGEVFRLRRKLTESRMHLDAALRLATDLQDLRGCADTEILLGLLDCDADDPDGAHARFTAAIVTGERLASREIQGEATKGLAHVAADRGDDGLASRLYRRAARLLTEDHRVAEALLGAAECDARDGRFDRRLLDRLVPLALNVGLGDRLATVLEPVFFGLSMHGNDNAAAMVLAVSIALPFRHQPNEGATRSSAEPNAEGYELDIPLVRAVSTARTWLDEPSEAIASQRRQALLESLESVVDAEFAENVAQAL
jgi:tetratricopeptide (TPR) repeat protein